MQSIWKKSRTLPTAGLPCGLELCFWPTKAVPTRKSPRSFGFPARRCGAGARDSPEPASRASSRTDRTAVESRRCETSGPEKSSRPRSPSGRIMRHVGRPGVWLRYSAFPAVWSTACGGITGSPHPDTRGCRTKPSFRRRRELRDAAGSLACPSAFIRASLCFK